MASLWKGPKGSRSSKSFDAYLNFDTNEWWQVNADPKQDRLNPAAFVFLFALYFALIPKFYQLDKDLQCET